MNIILITTLVIAVIGVCVGAGLVFTGKKFAVEVDEREVAVREKLPGNNCGACGFAGCDALAAAIAKGEAPVNACPVGGALVAQEIGDIMGTSAGAMERKVAFVACKGTCDVTKNQGNYVGIKDCRTAVLSGMNITECTYGCLGFGSCAEVCPEQAITIQNGVAVVNGVFHRRPYNANRRYPIQLHQTNGGHHQNGHQNHFHQNNKQFARSKRAVIFHTRFRSTAYC